MRETQPDEGHSFVTVFSLWSTFKHEYYYRHTFATKIELIAAVDNWMRFYNHQRRHSAIGMRSPIAYERTLEVTLEAS